MLHMVNPYGFQSIYMCVREEYIYVVFIYVWLKIGWEVMIRTLSTWFEGDRAL